MYVYMCITYMILNLQFFAYKCLRRCLVRMQHLNESSYFVKLTSILILLNQSVYTVYYVWNTLSADISQILSTDINVFTYIILCTYIRWIPVMTTTTIDRLLVLFPFIIRRESVDRKQIFLGSTVSRIVCIFEIVFLTIRDTEHFISSQHDCFICW